MERQLRYVDPTPAYVREHLRREVQAGRGRGHATGSFRTGINRLVALADFQPVFTGDIRRQRNAAQPLHYGKKIRQRIKTQYAFANLAAGGDLRYQFSSLPWSSLGS